MNASEIIKSIEAEQLKAEVPQFNVGDTVKVYGKIKEGNRERIQVFEGTVLKRQGGSNRETFTVRKISNGVGVEKTWPLHSPNVEKVEVVRQGNVRRAKLFYLRDRKGKRACKIIQCSAKKPGHILYGTGFHMECVPVFSHCKAPKLNCEATGFVLK